MFCAYSTCNYTSISMAVYFFSQHLTNMIDYPVTPVPEQTMRTWHETMHAIPTWCDAKDATNENIIVNYWRFTYLLLFPVNHTGPWNVSDRKNSYPSITTQCILSSIKCYHAEIICSLRTYVFGSWQNVSLKVLKNTYYSQKVLLISNMSFPKYGFNNDPIRNGATSASVEFVKE